MDPEKLVVLLWMSSGENFKATPRQCWAPLLSEGPISLQGPIFSPEW